MSLTGRLLSLLALVAVGVGLVSVVLRQTFGFSLTYTFVTLVGALAIVQGLRYVSRRRQSEYAETETGDPEQRFRVPTPGDEFDRQVSSALGWSLRNVSEQRDVRSRLHRTAVDVLVIHEHCSPDEAEAHIRAGTWTDDVIAAGFLSEEVPTPPLRTRLRLLFRRESRFLVQVRHTVDAIVSLREVGR
ncbi:hypothetical protein SAMN04487950_1859 [Halogranum rubrum]|uniref:Uncharacterized protein n=1 Tax=Halogranum rubrum TaxID=553466 RepID=A0A1I4E2T4_9EURY|nr:hypothetical protein [Halogranum rubrum]SFL00114.1 hypothetical protein SAMN04487950_1859 [Halogranum rubrum]